MSLAVALCLQDGGVDHFFAGISTEKVEIKFANLKFGRVVFFWFCFFFNRQFTFSSVFISGFIPVSGKCFSFISDEGIPMTTPAGE